MTLDAKVGRRRDKKCNYLKKILHSSCHFRAVIFGKVQKLLILIFEANSVNSLNCPIFKRGFYPTMQNDIFFVKFQSRRCT